MLEKIKLKDYAVAQYPELSERLNSLFGKIEPIRINLDSGAILSDYSGKFDLSIRPCSDTIMCKEDDYFSAVVFAPKICDDTFNRIVDMAQFKNLNAKARSRVIDHINRLKENCPEKYNMPLENLDVLKDIFHNDKAEYFDHLMDWYYDVRYDHNENTIDSHDIYSGLLKRKGLMTGFYQRLGQVIDFDSLDSLVIGEIVEPGTVKISETLKRLKNQGADKNSLLERLKKEYAQSPFMKMFDTLGFRDMELFTDEGYICRIKARKADNLCFDMMQEEE